MNRLLLFLLWATLASAAGCSAGSTCRHLTGAALGTTYSIITCNNNNNNNDTLQDEVVELMQRVEKSLSIYDKASIISKVNRNEDVALDGYFIECFEVARQVSKQTGGAFDISGSPLYAAWGFGANEHLTPPSRQQIDSLKQLCGMSKLSIVNGHLVKSDPRVQLNANAVAKGYAVDVVARFLEGKNITSYMVEIGGEVRCGSVKPNGAKWTIGIDSPRDGNFTPGADLASILEISDRAVATSGSYRRFYMSGAEKIPHIINPATGCPARNSLLSATVAAGSCAAADAYATAFMVMGVDSAKALLDRDSELEGFLIFSEQQQLRTYATPKFKDWLIKK
ncbi:MAG: FAD:protein FMN transferase [Prevotellaceae bacterium]|jgi:thiamine biosynthesis lipoprotein|nr:FAD:protein FMN transferase [Prevotellaceae bacterium]